MNIIMKLIQRMYIIKSIRIYGEYYATSRKTIEGILNLLEAESEEIVVWGAGLKGTAFLKIFDHEKKYIKGVFDIDSSRIGMKLSTEHLILDYKGKGNKNKKTVLLMNNNYETEVAGLIRKEKIQARLVNIDSIILGKLNVDEALNMYGEYL